MASRPKVSTSVLIVDDSSQARRFMKEILGRLGFQNIFEAGNGKTAMDLIAKEKIDLVISDWSMPEMDGIQLFRSVQIELGQPNVAFLMVTASNTMEHVMQAMREGVLHYIVKPYAIATVEAKLIEMGILQPFIETK